MERKKLSKSKIIEKIIDYVFKHFCDDEEIALMAQDYFEVERKLQERKQKKQKVAKSQNKNKSKVYKTTQEVRDFLEPLVDAEYIKHTIYKTAIKNEAVLYSAMDQLKTRQNKKLLKRIDKNGY